MGTENTYICIDLKSFYASVECVERGLDPMTANLVVADPERSEKTICLAVSPNMKKLGVKNRCRVFEIPRGIDYVMAQPRMQKYIDYAAEIYGIYLRWFSREDIHVYSIDEVFIDVTHYLGVYRCSPRELAIRIMDQIQQEIGVRATCGIGTNLYLTKIALDISAKHSPDFIGILDEEKYRETLWNHRPLTDFWRVGAGIARRLEKIGIFTMGDIAEADEDMLYQIFGVDAELLIDHAWGREPVTMADIKAYKPSANSITSGQVLMRDYSFNEGRTVIREMMDSMCLELVNRNLVCDSVTISVGYAKSDMPGASADAAAGAFGRYGHRDGGTVRFEGGSNEESVMVPEVVRLYERRIDNNRMVRRMNISCNNVRKDTGTRQINMFDVVSETGKSRPQEEILEKDRKIQEAELAIKKKYGKNAILKGVNMKAESTGRERNRQIGGHKSGE
ncbi:MAG: DNA repair protein [Clostridia bacterium]|nr:DNA repair protein [Clostridia bacterium]